MAGRLTCCLQGPSAEDQIPDFVDALGWHRRFDAIERSAASGSRV